MRAGFTFKIFIMKISLCCRSFLFTSLFLIGFGTCHAQIRESSACFYIKQSASPNTQDVGVALCNGYEARVWFPNYGNRRGISNNLANDIDYYDSWMNGGAPCISKYKYEPQLSTSARIVYSAPLYNVYMITGYKSQYATRYIAFSRDLSSAITWVQNNGSDKIVGKTYWKRINKSELLPKAANYDFLEN